MSILRLAASSVLATALLAASLASAQTTYRWTDPKSGTTVISDQPPPGVKQVVKRDGDEAGERQLPYATRQAVEKFPVTLYTTASCTDTCKRARDLLNVRGVPFAEREIKSQNDLAELSKQLGSEAAIPSLSVGRQSFKGFEAGAWNGLLDLAGYPKTAPYGAKPSGVVAK